MAVSFETMLLSRPFKFIVGVEEVPIMVYEAAVANQSRALSVLMQGEMSESMAGEAKWDDIDKGTFSRFIQFVYTKDYSVPQIVDHNRSDQHVLPHEGNRANTRDERDDFIRSRIDKKRRRTLPPKPTHSLELCRSISPPPKTDSPFTNACESTISDIYVWNNSEVLLAHASLYVLAEKWGVEKLKQLALSKLHQALPIEHVSATTIQDVVTLARYVYSDERTPELKHGMDGLRRFICCYINAAGDVASKHASLAALLREEGAFAPDLWKTAGPIIFSLND